MNPYSILPLYLYFCPILYNNSSAIQSIIPPNSFNPFPILINDFPISFPQIIFKLSNIFLPITPIKLTLPINTIIKPTPFIFFTIRPLISSLSRNIVINEIAFIDCSIVPAKYTIALFHTIEIITIVLRAIRPAFYAVSVLEVIFSLSFIYSP